MGSGVGVGGESGCSCGGAVSSVDPRCVAKPALVFLLMLGLTACSQPSAAPPDAATILQAIPAADPEKYPALGTSRHWSNPYLVIRGDGVGLLSGSAANEEQLLKPEEVMNALAGLPAMAWPYGRAVAVLVQQKPKTSEQEKIELRRNRGIVEGELEGAHVAIRWIPAP
jgi:hypothetical protein